tara:strand:+ start:516 stop:1034 length:519 start_codon:yes stop_codon:yes gene_type:complete
MSYSFTTTESKTFTLTHAKHLAAKVGADLMRLQRFYGSPSNDRIEQFEGEVAEMLRLGYLGTITYGFKRNDEWIDPTLRYTARELGQGSVDDDPGRIRPGMNVAGASFYSYMTYSSSWNALSAEQQAAVKKTLPLQRNGAPEPTVAGGGYFVEDRSYWAGGRSLGRQTIRSI